MKNSNSKLLKMNKKKIFKGRRQKKKEKKEKNPIS